MCSAFKLNVINCFKRFGHPFVFWRDTQPLHKTFVGMGLEKSPAGMAPARSCLLLLKSKDAWCEGNAECL